MRDDVTVDELARRAADGDHDALSALVRELQHPMYRLALRFVGHPEDAQDACQEILVRIVTRLGTFEGRSKFTTWAYTVATRSLLRTRKRVVESSVRGAPQFAALLDAGMGEIDTTLEEVEYRMLCEEVRISCTYGMLLCAASESAGILRGGHLPLAEHPREEVRVWIEPVARQLDEVVAIGDLYRFDRFAAPARLWDDLQHRYPELLTAG